MDILDDHYFHIGSMLCRVKEKSSFYTETLAACYGVNLLDINDITASLNQFDLNLAIKEEPAQLLESKDSFIVSQTDQGYLIETDPILCSVVIKETADKKKLLEAEITIRQPEMKFDLIGYHLWLITNRMLLFLDAVIIHAAAIELNGELNVFCGHKGAGKSTLSVFLGKHGAKILSEDRIIIRRSDSDFLVSGCSSKMKIMAKSEEYLLPNELTMKPDLISNIPKKVFEAKQFFSSMPHVDHKPARILFNQVGGAYHFSTITRNNALLRMIDRTADIYRFSNRQDYISFFGFNADFINQTNCYSVDLSPNLEDLPLLLESINALDER